MERARRFRGVKAAVLGVLLDAWNGVVWLHKAPAFGRCFTGVATVGGNTLPCIISYFKLARCMIQNRQSCT